MTSDAGNTYWSCLEIERGRHMALFGSFARIGLWPNVDYYFPMEQREKRRHRLSKTKDLFEVPFMPTTLFVKGSIDTFARVLELKYTKRFVAIRDVIVAIPEWQMTRFKEAIQDLNERTRISFESKQPMTKQEKREWKELHEGLKQFKATLTGNEDMKEAA